MNKETRRICFDETLQIEAYQLCGMIPDLPNHFHEHYAVGVIAAGNRRLRCKNREYLLEPGDIILLNPGESHACAAVDGDLDYRGFNIAPNVMERIRMEIAGPGTGSVSQGRWSATRRRAGSYGDCMKWCAPDPENSRRKRPC